MNLVRFFKTLTNYFLKFYYKGILSVHMYGEGGILYVWLWIHLTGVEKSIWTCVHCGAVNLVNLKVWITQVGVRSLAGWSSNKGVLSRMDVGHQMVLAVTHWLSHRAFHSSLSLGASLVLFCVLYLWAGIVKKYLIHIFYQKSF